jgi:alcohol dehydrogenase class IV
MQPFEYNANPGRVVFGSGSIRKLPDEVKRLNKSKPLLLSTPQQADQVKALQPILENASIRPAGLFSEATMHTPTDVTDKALQYTKDVGADVVISFGGGSTIGLGKAISVRTGLEHICIPTTYAGSEMTPILGETAEGRKTTRSDPKILPGTVIYDVDFTMTLPEALSATSGVNAIAHAGKPMHSLWQALNADVSD